MSRLPVQRAVYIGNESYSDGADLAQLVAELKASLSESDVAKEVLEDIVVRWSKSDKVFVDWGSVREMLDKSIAKKKKKLETIAPEEPEGVEYEGDTEFTVTDYRPGEGKPVEVKLSGLGIMATSGGVSLESARYSISAGVRIKASSSIEAAKWECGFIQTVDSSVRRSFFRGSDGEKRGVHVDYLSRKRDGLAERPAPWYRATDNAKFSSDGQTVFPRFWDGPGWVAEWNFGGGRLDHTDGRDAFATWLIARNRETGEVVFLHHEDWVINWFVGVDYGLSGKKKLSESGSSDAKTVHQRNGPGKGAKKPVLVDPVALESYQEQNLSWT